jgi:predicted dinucleotide-binding enzyme
MIFGIIGTDDRAVAIGRLLIRSGHAVNFSEPNGKTLNAERAAAALGSEHATASTCYTQTATCQALVFAIHWEELDRCLTAIGTYKEGLVIDAIRPPRHGAISAAQALAHRLDNRHVVKAFVEHLDAHTPIKVASDDPEARVAVEKIIVDAGGTVEDMGPLARAIEMEDAFTRSQPIL